MWSNMTLWKNIKYILMQCWKWKETIDPSFIQQLQIAELSFALPTAQDAFAWQLSL